MSRSTETMKPGRVLVIEDNAYARQAVCLILNRAGYDVMEAEDGEKAIGMMGSDRNESSIGAVICDLEMPHLTGSQTIAYFRQNHPLIPIVILTGAPDFVVTEVLREQGVTDYLIKPVSEKRLLEVIRVSVRLHALRLKQS